MIEVRHNQECITVDPRGFSGVRDLVRHCVGASKAPEPVVLALRVDGRELALESPEELDQVDLETLARVEIETRPAREIAAESLESSAEYVGALEGSLQQVADLLRAGRTEDANQLFATALDGFSVLLYALSAARTWLPAVAADLGDLEGEVHPWLEAVADAQEERDWLRVADYLEYELRPRLVGWAERIRGVCERAGSGAGVPAVE